MAALHPPNPEAVFINASFVNVCSLELTLMVHEVPSSSNPKVAKTLFVRSS